MKDRKAVMKIKPPSPGSKLIWIKLNANQTGFYRVNYDKSLIDALAVELSHNAKDSSGKLIPTALLTTADRMGI